MSGDISVEALTRAWTHSREEDSGDLVVFRPSDYEFPPARGRDSMELGPGGELRGIGPGPDDRRITQAGTWALDGQHLTLHMPGRADTQYDIDSVDNERLIVRRSD